MLYEAKQGTKAYEYIKSILDAEFEEHKAYMKRVEEAVGFKFEKYQGYQPNSTLTREYEITAIWVPSERYDTLDKKVWKKVDGVKLEDGYYLLITQEIGLLKIGENFILKRQRRIRNEQRKSYRENTVC